ncbi:hypothetical protein, partial [Microcoleus sp. herbarium12]|uniref:hypothetical protein n=1 Tax=Microcoleus sp. herbarium12 TaxID=3055437 RepID=UPI002FD33008
MVAFVNKDFLFLTNREGAKDAKGRKFGNGLCNGCNGCNGCKTLKEEGSSATDYVTDVTDVT